MFFSIKLFTRLTKTDDGGYRVKFPIGNYLNLKLKIMKKNIFYLITGITFLFISCKKNDFKGLNFPVFSGITLNVINFDTNALSFIILPANRYFIYKDSSNGITDSVVVKQTNVESVLQQSVQNPPTPVFFYSKYTLILEKISGATNQIWYKGIARCDSQYTAAPVSIDSNFVLSNEQTNLPAFWYPFKSSGTMQYTLIPILTIENSTYTTVHKFSATNGLQFSDINYQATIYYWVKGTGIIKKEIISNNSVKTYLLIRYG